MIRHVSLTAWKAFEQLDLDLPEGTSFIVARNGVGKTSLLQALHFGLFGDRHLLSSGSPVERAVRGGEGEKAVVELTVDLNGQEWVVTREVDGSTGARVPLAAPAVTVNGVRSSDAAWKDALTGVAEVGLTELRLLAAIGEGGTLSAAETKSGDQYNLIEHLSSVLGVSRLRRSAITLRQESRTTAKAADNERLTLRDRPQRSSLTEEANLRSEREPLIADEHALVERLEAINARNDRRSAWVEWRARKMAYARSALSALETLRTAVGHHTELAERVLGRRVGSIDVPPSDPDEQLLANRFASAQRIARQLLSDLRSRRDAELRAVGAVDAQLKSIELALDLLSTAGAHCPTCRQPLSEAAAEHARFEHLRERSQLQENQAGVQSTVSQLDDAIGELTQATAYELPAPPSPPSVPPLGDDTDDESTAARDAGVELDQVRARLRRLDESLGAIDRQKAQLSDDAALSRRLVGQYRRADLAAAAADAFDALADSICRERIDPLAQLLTKRSSDLWPGRPQLGLDVETGHIVGQAAGRAIALADLSGGERAVAIILLRLLALQSASNSPILLMDEPLEHLDPRNRRLLASLLVAATRARGDAAPRQLLVTTYEESVTRRLSQQVAGSGSNVVYVGGPSATN